MYSLSTSVTTKSSCTRRLRTLMWLAGLLIFEQFTIDKRLIFPLSFNFELKVDLIYNSNLKD